MVSIPCNYTLALGLPNTLRPRRRPAPIPHPRPTPPPPCRPRPSHLLPNAFPPRSSDPAPQENQQLPRTLFPGGFKRPEVRVPGLVLRVTTEEVLRREESRAEIGAAVVRGVGIVVLESGNGSGGELYEAAGVLRSVIGDRAYLLVAERVDVASAAGASGVVLSDQGIPAIIARNMMMRSRSDSIYLPIVARTVQTVNSALSASSSEGADFLILDAESENSATVLENSVIQEVKVPTFFSTSSLQGGNLELVAVKLLQSGVCGLVMSLDDVKLFDAGTLKMFSPVHSENRILQDIYHSSTRLEADASGNKLNRRKKFAGFSNIDDQYFKLIEAEKLLLQEAVATIRTAAPMMKEVSLLVDAATRLTEPFLLVIVGEFNSGKSTVINALLGRRYLKEGVIPTTNEITLLCYSDMDVEEQVRCERYPDGQFICYLPAPILTEMNLVDTPGTNVILQRQQRLTEEFVPRADLVLFVMSSDRPLCESEVAFLLYMQQWKKKVVFVLNKMDLYQSASELEEAMFFIIENTRKLLNTEDVRVYPVSARLALEAKLSALAYDGRNIEQILVNDPRWLTSGFDELEKFLFSFLDGSTHTGMERLMLKLETPIGIADRLLNSCEKLVNQEYRNASQDFVSIEEAVGSVKDHALKMESESISWRKQTLSLIEKAKARAVEFIESTLQLSNVDLIATYAFKGERSGSIPPTTVVQNDIIGPALSSVQRLLWEYSMWLQSQTVREVKFYEDYFDKRWHTFKDKSSFMQQEEHGLLAKVDEQSIKVTENFSASAAARLFEQEIREVVLGTFGGLGAAGLSASLLTSVLPTTLEDLLALALCSAGGFLAISNFPVRRKEAIEKVRKVADGLAGDVEEAMLKDLQQTSKRITEIVKIISKPYKDVAEQNVNQLTKIQEDLATVEQKLQAMKVEMQNLNVS